MLTQMVPYKKRESKRREGRIDIGSSARLNMTVRIFVCLDVN